MSVDRRKVTISGRVALLLSAVEPLAALFAAGSKLNRLIQALVRDGWSWLESREPDPSQIYWRYSEPLAEAEGELDGDERRLAALAACRLMHSYLVWKADGVAHLEQPDIELSIGNDIAEVNESYLSECFREVSRAFADAPAITEWLAALTAAVERQCPAGGDAIGKPPARAQLPPPPRV